MLTASGRSLCSMCAMKQEKSRAVASLERSLRHLNSRYRFRRDVATDLRAVEMDFLDAPVAADMQPGGKGRADHAVGYRRDLSFGMDSHRRIQPGGHVLRHLIIGKPAPVAEGEDLNGRPMNWSDDRGK